VPDPDLGRLLQPEVLWSWLQASGVREGDTLGVAFSGGLDSTVLLHLCHRLPASLAAQITALHVDHGLNAQSGQWRKHCEKTASRWGVAFKATKLSLPGAQRRGPEAAARKARYRALEQLNPGRFLLVAHHQQDQAETVLLRLIRGSGVTGLAAMQPVSCRQNTVVLRPFLSLEKTRLEAYARHYDVQWLDDPANTDLHYDRNQLRHVIIPQMRKMRPGVDQVLARVSKNMAQSRDLLEEIAQADLGTVTVSAHSYFAVAVVLDCQRLAALSTPRRVNLLRYWIKSAIAYAPSSHQQHGLEQLSAGSQRSGLLPLGRYSCRRYRDHLHLLCRLPLAPERPEHAYFPGLWTSESSDLVLSGQLDSQGGLLCRKEGYAVHFRQGGESLRWHGHRRSLKTLLQQFAIPPWERSLLPLLYVKGELVAVADLWIADGWRSGPGNAGITLHW